MLNRRPRRVQRTRLVYENRVCLAFAALLGLLILAPQSAVSQDTSTASTLDVHVSYMGSGTVDKNTRSTSCYGIHLHSCRDKLCPWSFNDWRRTVEP